MGGNIGIMKGVNVYCFEYQEDMKDVKIDDKAIIIIGDGVERDVILRSLGIRDLVIEA